MIALRQCLAPLLLLLIVSPASGATLEELRARYHREKGKPLTVRYKTLQEVSALGTEGAVRFLAEVIKKDKQFPVRSHAAGQLGRIPRKSAFAALERIWKSAENNLKVGLLSALLNHPREPGLRDVVEEALESDYKILRATLIRWLGKSGDERFLPEVERFIEEFPTGAVSLLSPLRAAGTPAAARVLVRIYDNTRKRDRNEVPGFFSGGKKDVQQVLVEALRGRDEKLVANAIAIATRGRLGIAEPALVALLDGANRERKARLIEAIGAVGAGTPEGRAAILKALADKHTDIAIAAARAVRQVPGKDRIPLLIRAMEGAPAALRAEIRVTLERATGQQFGDRPDLWRKWWKKYGEEFDPENVRKPEGNPVDVPLVNLAIEKGAAALKSIRSEREPWKYSSHPVGTTALVCLALHAAGVDRQDPDLRAGVEYLLEATLPNHTYTLGLVAMALESIGGKRYRSRVVECGKKLISSQLDSGLWGYPLGDPTGDGDNSNTQYAVLGLRSAARVGMRIPKRTWRRVRDHFLRTRCADWGWAYKPSYGGLSSASMTAGGVSSLLICLENMKLNKAERETLLAAIEQGFTALGKKMNLDKDTLYALYGIERAGILGGKQTMAGKPWYPPGAKRLLSEQDDEGFWRGVYNEAIDTSFAILFLKKATVPIATK